MTNTDSGNVPRMTRWSTPKKYDCTHDGCTIAALICSPHSRLETKGPHNCCDNHDHIANHDMVMAIARKIMVRDAGILELLRQAEEREKSQ